MLKKIILTLSLSLCLIAVPCTAMASVPQSDTIISIEILENGDYIETIIEDTDTGISDISSFSTTKSITKIKRTNYKNASGDILWYVAITATFSYNGSTSKCTSCSHSASAPASNWTIKSVSSSKSENSATAKAVATFHTIGKTTDYSKSVTITCSPSGIVS